MKFHNGFARNLVPKTSIFAIIVGGVLKETKIKSKIFIYNSRNQKKNEEKNAENFKHSNWKQFGTEQANSYNLNFQFERLFEDLLFLR